MLVVRACSLHLDDVQHWFKGEGEREQQILVEIGMRAHKIGELVIFSMFLSKIVA